MFINLFSHLSSKGSVTRAEAIRWLGLIEKKGIGSS